MRTALLRSLFVFVAALLACGDHTAPSSPSSSAALDGRTYILKVPQGYDGSTRLPLVIATHGYAGSGSSVESYFALDPVADERGFFVVYPDGTVDQAGHRFFNATDACCDFYGTGVDDVAFIGALIDHIESAYAIDRTRVYAVGYSNGGFLSYRLACDLSSRIAAIVSLEGAMWDDPSRCRPTDDVAVLEVHGSDDVVISPAGGDVVDSYPDRVYPPLAQTLGSWASFDGCPGTTVSWVEPGDIDSETSQATQCQRWTGCRTDVELWMNQGGTHSPTLTSVWPVAIVDFLMAHAKSNTDAIAVH
jgi:polyhydroxybutyrate depolymerase